MYWNIIRFFVSFLPLEVFAFEARLRCLPQYVGNQVDKNCVGIATIKKNKYIHPSPIKLLNTCVDGVYEKFQILNKTVALSGLRIVTTR